jgi:hypothetical protein
LKAEWSSQLRREIDAELR